MTPALPPTWPPVRGAVVRLLRQGVKQRDIAARYGVHVRTLEYYIADRQLFPEQFGLIRSAHLAVEVGVSRQALVYQVRQGHFSDVPWGTSRCFTAAEAKRVRAFFDHPKLADHAGWLSTPQVAPLVGTSDRSLARLIVANDARLDGVRWQKVQGIGGFSYLFHPADIPLLTRRLKRKAIPKRYAGRHTAPQLADLLGVPEKRVIRWSGGSLPRLKDWHGRNWYALDEVRAWLAGGAITPRDLPALLARLDALLAPAAVGEAA